MAGTTSLQDLAAIGLDRVQHMAAVMQRFPGPLLDGTVRCGSSQQVETAMPNKSDVLIFRKPPGAVSKADASQAPEAEPKATAASSTAPKAKPKANAAASVVVSRAHTAHQQPKAEPKTIAARWNRSARAWGDYSGNRLYVETPNQEGFLVSAREAVVAAIAEMSGGAMESMWTFNLVTILCPLAKESEKLCNLLPAFGWTGSQFRRPPDLYDFLSVLEDECMASAQ